MKLLAAVLLFLAFSVQGQTVTYISTTGSDANDCLSAASACATPVKAAAVGGQRGVVLAGCGNYGNVALDIAHSAYILFRGCNCSDPSATGFYSSSATPVITVEDHATIAVECMKLATTVNGSTAIYARQFAIADWYNMIFGHFPQGRHVVLSEMSKGNCLGDVAIMGDAVSHAEVSGMSSASLNCNMTFYNNPIITNFVTAGQLSFVLIDTATFSGSASIGTSYVVNTSLLKKGSVTIPGGAGSNSNGWIQ